MKLTKGKISKLYHKKRQSVKRYKKGNKNIQNKTFRKKRHIDLSRLTLKNFKGGLLTLQNKRSEVKAKQDAIVESIPPQSRIPGIPEATPINDADVDVEEQNINKEKDNDITASSPLEEATESPLPSAPPSPNDISSTPETSNTKIEGAINVIIDELVNRISAKMVSKGEGLQDPFISVPTAAQTEQNATKEQPKPEEEQMVKGAEQIQNVSEEPEPEPVLADANIINKDSMAKAEVVPQKEGEEDKEVIDKSDASGLNEGEISTPLEEVPVTMSEPGEEESLKKSDEGKEEEIKKTDEEPK